jgi:hypothetical protein
VSGYISAGKEKRFIKMAHLRFDYKNKHLKLYGFIDPINIETKNYLRGETNMTTLRQAAKKYEPKTTLNVSDLKEVSTENDIMTKSFTKNDGEMVSYQAIEVDGQEYRMPISVIKQLKEMIDEKPNMTKFKVKKSGTGMSTKYTVIPLD